jgi:hypothetical protein
MFVILFRRFKHRGNFITLLMPTVYVEEDMDFVLDLNPTLAGNPLQPLLLDLHPDRGHTCQFSFAIGVMREHSFHEEHFLLLTQHMFIRHLKPDYSSFQHVALQSAEVLKEQHIRIEDSDKQATCFHFLDDLS